jgi:hypothetical protein
VVLVDLLDLYLLGFLEVLEDHHFLLRLLHLLLLVDRLVLYLLEFLVDPVDHRFLLLQLVLVVQYFLEDLYLPADPQDLPVLEDLWLQYYPVVRLDHQHLCHPVFLVVLLRLLLPVLLGVLEDLLDLPDLPNPEDPQVPLLHQNLVHPLVP